MKKILVIMILLLTTIGCALLDAELYEEVKKDREERGTECYKKGGYYYCEDTYSD